MLFARARITSMPTSRESLVAGDEHGIADRRAKSKEGILAPDKGRQGDLHETRGYARWRGISLDVSLLRVVRA